MPWPTDPEESGQRERNLFFEGGGGEKKRQQYIKCFFFNETNPKDVQSGSSCAVHKHGGNKNKQIDKSSRESKLTQDEAGLAAGGISSGRHWGRSHWAGHRGSGHRLLLTLPQAGLQVCVHVFMNVAFSLQI